MLGKQTTTMPVQTPPIEVARRLIAAQRILALCHVDPDGDAIGSLVLGFGWLLREVQGDRTIVLACQDAVPQNLRFLPGADQIVSSPDPLPWDARSSRWTPAIPQRLGRPLRPAGPRPRGRPLIVIDHHITNLFFGDFNSVNPGAAATAQILVDFAESLGVTITAISRHLPARRAAHGYAGFRTSNTTAATLATACGWSRPAATLRNWRSGRSMTARSRSCSAVG